MTEMKIALSIEEAADYTGIGRNTLRDLVKWKKLPVLQVGRKVLIKTDYKMSRPNVQKILYKNVQLVCLLYVVF